MEAITVLSPHYDDSSFSLGLALSFWGAASIKLHVVNFFTQSAYAPHSTAETIADVSAVRDEEDKKALAFIHGNIETTSLGLLDAPLRLGLPFSEITKWESVEKISRQEFFQLSQHIQQHCSQSLVIAPLSLGNHVDHRAVHGAALTSLQSENLAFYEDLPYASWTSPADLQARVTSVEHSTGMALEPFVLHMESAVARKRRIASFYQSQITAEEADVIAKFAESYGSGERLWLPASSQRWKAIRLLATKLPQTAIPRQPK